MSTPPNATHEVSRERDLRDLGDIAALKRFEPFERYWMRCLRQKQEAKLYEIVHTEMTKDKREELRQQMLFLEEILDMPSAHEASIRRTLPDGIDLESPS